MSFDLKGKIKVPLLGEMPTWAVFGGLGVTGYFIYRYRKNSASATGTTAANPNDPYPPDGTVGNPQDLYSTDPATNMTYGDEQAGYMGSGGTTVAPGSGIGGDAYPWDGTYNNPNDPYSMDTSTGSTYGDEGGGTGGGGGGGGTNGPPFSTNAQWSSYAIATLGSDDPSLDVGKLTTALGLYVTGGQVTADQESLINDAIAIAGTPPVSGPNNMPPSINVVGSKGGGGGGSKVTVPKVTGQEVDAAGRAIEAAGLKYKHPPLKAGHGYKVTSQSPKAGAKVAKNSTVSVQIAENKK